MNQTSKKILTIPLLALALMPVLFSVYFLIQLKIAQHEAKEKLEKSMLETIYLKQGDFSWVKKGKEIRIGKHLFDVKNIKESGAGFIITGIYDEKEDQLHERLNNFSQQENQPTQNKLCNFFFHFYYSIPLHDDGDLTLSTPKTIFTYYYSLELPSPFRGKFFPPPNLI